MRKFGKALLTRWPRRCPQCGHKLDRMRDLVDIMSWAGGGRYGCTKCGLKFRYVSPEAMERYWEEQDPPKTLGDYIPCDEQEAFVLDGEDYAGDGGLLDNPPIWPGDLAEKVAELDARIVDLECASLICDRAKDLSRRISELMMRTDVRAWRLQDELDHLKERLAELEAGDGRRD